MPQEVRVLAEGTLAWVQASGTGGWNTASAPASGTIGFVQAGFAFPERSMEFATVSNRGVPSHHKLVRINPLEVSFTVLYGVTADYPAHVTASGTSTPQVHLEFKQSSPEGTSIWHELLNCVIPQRAFTEQDEGNQLAFTVRAISSIGPTASGRVIA